MIPERNGKNSSQRYFEDQCRAGGEKNTDENKVGGFFLHIRFYRGDDIFGIRA